MLSKCVFSKVCVYLNQRFCTEMLQDAFYLQNNCRLLLQLEFPPLCDGTFLLHDPSEHGEPSGQHFIGIIYFLRDLPYHVS